MIELRMVHRMIRMGLFAAPAVVAILWAWGGAEAAVSSAVGLVMALANLWLAGRIIGGVADNNPQLLLAAAMVAFGAGLGLLTGSTLALQALDLVSFPVAGLTLIGTHLVLVTWEAARAYPVKSPSTHDDGVKVGS
ncbi:MAG: hypothetical protein ABR529_05545 [Actinomycetota bacterium]